MLAYGAHYIFFNNSIIGRGESIHDDALFSTCHNYIYIVGGGGGVGKVFALIVLIHLP